MSGRFVFKQPLQREPDKMRRETMNVRRISMPFHVLRPCNSPRHVLLSMKIPVQFLQKPQKQKVLSFISSYTIQTIQGHITLLFASPTLTGTRLNSSHQQAKITRVTQKAKKQKCSTSLPNRIMQSSIVSFHSRAVPSLLEGWEALFC
jgi:hypothetical protein